VVTNETIIIFSGKNPLKNPGGLGSYSLSLAQSFTTNGNNVKIICFGPEDSTCLVFEYVEIIQLKVKWDFLFSVGSILINSQLGSRAADYIRDNQVENIVALIGAGIWFQGALKVKKKLGLRSKLIAAYFTTYRHEYRGHLNGSDFRIFGPIVYLQSLMLYVAAYFIFSKYEKKGLSKCDLVLTHYQSTRELLIAEMPELENIIKVTQMPNLYISKDGPGIKFPESGYKAEENLNFLLVNRLDPRKGLGLFLKSYRKLLKTYPERKFHCNIVGSGYFSKYYESLVKKLSLNEFVEFHGYLADPYELVNSKTIYVLSALEEGSSSISLIEAMSKKLPSIVTNIDGMKEDVRDGKEGFLYDPYDPDSFVRKVGFYLDQPELLGRHGEAAFLRFRNRFPDHLTLSDTESIKK